MRNEWLQFWPLCLPHKHDTLINGQLYGAIYREGVYWFCCNPVLGPNNGYIGGLRNDSLGRKVWFVPRDSISEFALYDFSLNVGDTVPAFLTSAVNTTCETFVIAAVDSVQINDGSYRRRQHVEETQQNCFNTTFIEGIGGTSGLFEACIAHFDVSADLACLNTKNGVDYTSNLTGMNCNVVVSIPEEESESLALSIFTNASGNRVLHVQHVDALQQINVTTYDAMGRLVSAKSALPLSNLIPLTSGNANAIYMYEFTVSLKNGDTRKVRIKH